eukprot:TRINITY_DN5332_c2_g1_i2.p2 TRINITY_DN5332_c2_g1~~TRINITY_DN5332_c2_g1_i2.p2  ORF type:complete len:349 (+),score=64.08 TRINITY_DN5332_c2_g1_i2:833-1879(+)
MREVERPPLHERRHGSDAQRQLQQQRESGWVRHGNVVFRRAAGSPERSPAAAPRLQQWAAGLLERERRLVARKDAHVERLRRLQLEAEREECTFSPHLCPRSKRIARPRGAASAPAAGRSASAPTPEATPSDGAPPPAAPTPLQSSRPAAPAPQPPSPAAGSPPPAPPPSPPAEHHSPGRAPQTPAEELTAADALSGSDSGGQGEAPRRPRRVRPGPRAQPRDRGGYAAAAQRRRAAAARRDSQAQPRGLREAPRPRCRPLCSDEDSDEGAAPARAAPDPVSSLTPRESASAARSPPAPPASGPTSPAVSTSSPRSGVALVAAACARRQLELRSPQRRRSPRSPKEAA